MTDRAKTISKFLAILLVAGTVAVSLYIGAMARADKVKTDKVVEKLQKDTAAIQHILDDKKKGKRKNPFRCSDAKHYFNTLGVDVDCQRIEDEVNGSHR